MSKRNPLLAFAHEQFGNIRCVLIDGVPWFVGKDVAVALGYTNPRDTLKKHVDTEDKRMSQIATPGGSQKMTLINESGLYALIFGSNLPAAKKFKRWVTSEVLPSIRQTGTYTMSKKDEVREHGKTAGRRPLTDSIQLFEKRDKPKNPGMYYALPTRFIQSELCRIPKGGRDGATIDQLVMLTVLENASANVFKKASEQGKSYRDAIHDVTTTATFLKRVYEGEIPLVG